MAEIKTKVNGASVEDFINSVEGETKRQDAHGLLKMFERISGEPAKMWGSSIIGFGMYHYKSERSAQEGDWPLIAFSPRKQNLTIYIMPGFAGLKLEIEKLGKHKTSVSCLYINQLSDIDMNVLETIVAKTYSEMKKKYS